MRNWFTLFLSVSLLTISLGQPINDSCEDALFLALGPPPSCELGEVNAASITADNVGASSSFPAIQLADDFGSGAAIGALTSDVWFEIEPSSNRITIEVAGGLEAAVVVLFQADSCNNKLPLAWAEGPSRIEAMVQAGQRYLVLVGQSGSTSQGTFTLTIDSENDCSTCARRQGRLKASPAPVNGTYEAGQRVQFCYDIPFWDPGLSLEWLHGFELQFGPGWDLSTLETTAPEACTGPSGNWAWYDSWQSCNTEQFFGPGFAFDARHGLLCAGATPLDGDPGNNFGDGPCGNSLAGPLSLEFCWTVTVSDNFSTPEESNLNLEIALLGDGYSGSWMQYSCQDEPATTFFATAVPERLLLPSVDILRAPCASSCDGMIRLSSPLGGEWIYTLNDETGALIHQAGPGVDTLSNLCPGSYQLVVADTSSDISQSATVELAPGLSPEAQAGFIPNCQSGESIQLVAGVNMDSPNTSYLWTGPNGFSSTLANPSVEEVGKYTLQVAVDGCIAAPAVIQASSGIPEVACEPGAGSVLFQWEAQPQDTAYEINVLSGQMGGWLSETSYEVQGLQPGEEAVVELRKSGTGLCSLAVAESGCSALECPPPTLSASQSICLGEEAVLSVDAPPAAIISWGPGATLSCTDCPEPIASPSATTTYHVTVTDPEGCTSTQSVTLTVNSLPDNIFPDGRQAFCPGKPLKVCLPQENQYIWFSPIGFIRTGNCLNFPYATESIAGQYSLRVKLPNGCQFTEQVELYPKENCSGDNGEPGIRNWTFSERRYSTSLYPNPAQHILNIVFPTAVPRTLSLYRLDGQLAYRMETRDWQVQLPTETLPAGNYLLKALSTEGCETYQVAIIK